MTTVIAAKEAAMEAARELESDATPEEPTPKLRLAYLALTEPSTWFGELVLELTEEDIGA
jgi:hypothetical protein